MLICVSMNLYAGNLFLKTLLKSLFDLECDQCAPETTSTGHPRFKNLSSKSVKKCNIPVCTGRNQIIPCSRSTHFVSVRGFFLGKWFSQLINQLKQNLCSVLAERRVFNMQGGRYGLWAAVMGGSLAHANTLTE